MNNELQKILVFPETRQDIRNYISNVKQSILEGENDPLKVLKMLKCFENIIKELKEDQDIQEMILNESDKYSEKTIELHGCKFTKQERPTWDYSECNDSVLSSYEKEMQFLDEKIKERKEFLKLIPENFVNSETGEILNRATKKSKSIISVTLK